MTSFYSPKSIKNFVRTVLGLNPPLHCFHQVLSFKENIQNSWDAKPFLKTFLDAMHKSYKMASFFVVERQERGAVHFHVVFLVYDARQLPASAEQAKKEFRATAYKRWDRITQSTGTRAGNRLGRVEKNFRTLSYWFENDAIKPLPSNVPHPRREPNWWGIRNKQTIQANSRAVPKKELLDTYWKLIADAPKSLTATKPAQKYYRTVWNKQRLEGLRDYVDQQGKYDWETFKRVTAGQNGKVSDLAFIDLMNRKESLNEQRILGTAKKLSSAPKSNGDTL